jgi:hypothetical protein
MTELDDVNIRHIKLVTGDELIAIVLDNDDLPEDDHSPDVLYVQKPMQIQIRTLAEGTSFLFYEWQPFGKGDVCFINPFHIVSHMECSNDIKGQYINVVVNSPSDDEEPEDDESSETEYNILPERILH